MAMPVTLDQPAPYAPASAILELIDRHRNKGLPGTVDTDVLLRAGISDSLVPRTLQALKTLDLLTEEGRPSETFEGLRLASTGEYQKKLSEWLQAAYADALAYIDPASDDETAIRDAFRKYIPTGQQARMVTLFTGLFTAAGIIPAKGKSTAEPKRSSNAKIQPKTKPRQTAARHAAPTISSPVQPSPSPHGSANVSPAIAGLLATLPSDGGYWTQQRRDQFITTLSAVLDYTFKIGEPPTSAKETEYDL